ncbi:phage tail terminator protein [Neptuniibacter marinus]|uniref:phage tail terminator protein n=1 Tax=Neptuniibacter marinus TaxID=1806670 RepID=UPI003B59BFE7
MFEPFDTALIERHLADEVSAVQSVGGAADYAAVTEMRGFRHGTAYVVLAQEVNTADPDAQPGARQRGKSQALVTFGVIVAVRNYRDSTGDAAKKDAMPLIGSVRKALLGWTPDLGIMRPIAWKQGDVLDYDKNTLLWIDVFTTTRFIGGN